MNSAGAAREFAYLLDPVPWARESCAVMLDPWQARIVRAAAYGRNVACAAARQSGKGEAAAVFAAWALAHGWRRDKRNQADTLVLVVSASLRQASEFIKRTRLLLLRALPSSEIDGDSALELKLRSGPRVVSVPTGVGARGYPSDATIIDEAAFHADADIDAVTPTVAARKGVLVLLSTPSGPNNTFARAVLDPQPGWHVERVTWQDCPRLDRNFIEDRKRTMRAASFRTEFEASFEQDEGAVFERSALEALLVKEETRAAVPRDPAPTGAASLLVGAHS